MPYRVPGGNLVGRLIGLGNLDKLERERNMRRAQQWYDRPLVTQGYLNGPSSGFPRLHSHIPDGLPHRTTGGPYLCGQCERHQSGINPQGRRVADGRGDFDGCNNSCIQRYYDEHGDKIHSFIVNARHAEGRRTRPESVFAPEGMRHWVKRYREYLYDMNEFYNTQQSISARYGNQLESFQGDNGDPRRGGRLPPGYLHNPSRRFGGDYFAGGHGHGHFGGYCSHPPHHDENGGEEDE